MSHIILADDQTAQAAPGASTSENERQSLLARLAVRSKHDGIMCRAAKRLSENPLVKLDQLASELGVSERYLVAGLQTVLGVGPELLAPNSEPSAS